MVCNFLHIRVFRLVGLLCRFALIQYLKGDHAFEFRSGRFRNDPCRIKVLNGFQTGDNGGLQAGGRKDNKVMCESRIFWLIPCKV